MTTRPYELLARFAADGSVAGVSVRTIETVNGRDWPGDPSPLSGATDPAFTAFAQAFAAAATAQRDQLLTDKSSLESQVTTLTGERDALQAEVTRTSDRDSLHDQLTTAQSTIAARDATIAQLQAQLDAILHPPGPDLTTLEGVKQFISNTRYTKETGGITIEGQSISTERDEIGHWFPRFYDAYQWLQGNTLTNPSGEYPYKPKNGEPVVLSAAQVVRAYQCLAWYINACFAVERGLYLMAEGGALSGAVEAAESAATWPQTAFTWEPPA